MAYISEIKLPNNSTYVVKDRAAHYYATCTTAAATVTKEATITNFVLEEGARITLTFTYGNSAAAPTLSINNDTAKSFVLMNDNIYLWNNGETCDFIYNGTGWVMVNYDKIEVVRL